VRAYSDAARSAFLGSGSLPTSRFHARAPESPIASQIRLEDVAHKPGGTELIQGFSSGQMTAMWIHVSGWW
jgi:hypothetical protein